MWLRDYAGTYDGLKKEWSDEINVLMVAVLGKSKVLMTFSNLSISRLAIYNNFSVYTDFSR